MPNEPVKLSEASIQQGNAGAVRPVFSASGHRVSEDVNILYLGIHGDTIRISLSDVDLQEVIDILRSLQHASPKSKEKRVNSYK